MGMENDHKPWREAYLADDIQKWIGKLRKRLDSLEKTATRRELYCAMMADHNSVEKAYDKLELLIWNSQ